jgi:RNA polymerase sigma-70 factor (ECF subfamily)
VQGEAGAAFEELVSRYEARIYQFLFKRTGHVHDAQDLTQKTFVKAFQKMDRFKAGNRFSSWLYAIARNTAISHYRSRRETVAITTTTAMDHQDPATTLVQEESRVHLWDRARAVLPEKQFTALWLRYADDMSIGDIASVLKVGEANARVLLHRGRNRLARELEKESEP